MKIKSQVHLPLLVQPDLDVTPTPPEEKGNPLWRPPTPKFERVSSPLSKRHTQEWLQEVADAGPALDHKPGPVARARAWLRAHVLRRPPKAAQ